MADEDEEKEEDENDEAEEEAEEAEDGPELFVEEQADLERPMLRLFTEYGRQFPVSLLTALGANVVSPLFGLIPAFIFGTAIDAVIVQNQQLRLPFVPQRFVPAGQTDQFLLLVGIIVAAYTVNAGLTLAGSWGWTVFAENVQHTVRTDAYDKVQRLGMEFFSDRQTGQMMSIVGSDVNQLNTFLNGWLGMLVNIGVQFLGITAVMLSLNWRLALVALVPAPVIAAVSYKFIDVIRPKYQEVRSTFGELNSRIENNLSGIEVVKSFATEPFESERVADASGEHFDARWDARSLHIRFGPSLTVVTGYGFALVLLVGGFWVFNGPYWWFAGTLTIGTLVTFLQYTRQIQRPMQQSGFLLNQFEDVKASAERVFALLDHPVHVPEREDAAELTDVAGRVEYEDVHFAYRRAGAGDGDEEKDEGENEEALSGVSFAVDPGEMVGLVGPTGSGKTTLLKLVMRLYDPTEGSVRVDGRDVREYTLRSLREAIGYVSQEPFLFSGPVRENISYGMAADDEAIVAAAKRANAHEFIEDLPDEYDTEVGQRGVKLSGGQRQRIAIARAILKDPEILVLDEATSHVDNETEVLIQRSLEDLIADRTTFVIAHRLSTVRAADIILVLEDGEITERGPHEELLARDGLYANLWRVQVGEIDRLPREFLEAAAARDRA